MLPMAPPPSKGRQHSAGANGAESGRWVPMCPLPAAPWFLHLPKKKRLDGGLWICLNRIIPIFFLRTIISLKRALAANRRIWRYTCRSCPPLRRRRQICPNAPASGKGCLSYAPLIRAGWQALSPPALTSPAAARGAAPFPSLGDHQQQAKQDCRRVKQKVRWRFLFIQTSSVLESIGQLRRSWRRALF